jgi:hypothetical protein
MIAVDRLLPPSVFSMSFKASIHEGLLELDFPQDRCFSENTVLMGVYSLFMLSQTLRFNKKLYSLS